MEIRSAYRRILDIPIRRDQAGAVASYRKALALGGTVSIPQFFKTADANFAFDSGTMSGLVDLIEEQINELEHV